MPRLYLPLFAFALAICASAAQAQQNPLPGTWSFSATRSDGSAAYAYFFQFAADGRFQQQLTTSVGMQTFVGTYQLSPDMRTLQLIYHDYEPKQLCRNGFCYPLPPGLPMGTPINAQIEFNSPTRFVIMDASGPMLWVKQY